MLKVIMDSSYPNRVKLAVILMTLLVLLSNLQLLVKTMAKFNPNLVGNDKISLYEKRFEGLRRILPSHGVVGYLADREVVSWLGDKRWGEAYYLTQYCLSPVIVVNNREHNLVVGNFLDSNTNHKISIDKDLTLLKDFGNGVMLFHRKIK